MGCKSNISSVRIPAYTIPQLTPPFKAYIAASNRSDLKPNVGWIKSLTNDRGETPPL
jgi:hypothetical protein